MALLARGRKPIGERAMTAAERQRRRREKQAAVRSHERNKAAGRTLLVALAGVLGTLGQPGGRRLPSEVREAALKAAQSWLDLADHDLEIFPKDDHLRGEVLAAMRRLQIEEKTDKPDEAA
jgi:hypothetical protein